MSFVPYRIYQDQIVEQSAKELQAVWNEPQHLSFRELQIENGQVANIAAIVESDQKKKPSYRLRYFYHKMVFRNNNFVKRSRNIFAGFFGMG